MKSGEQSNAFMVIVKDPSIEIAQEPQVNVAEGVVMQYIGVARTDAKGLVQVGVRPEVLEKTLAGTELSVVLKDIDFGENGYIYAIDADNGQLLAHRNSSLIGTSAADAGFPAALTGKGKAVVDGVKGYYMAQEYEGQIIGTFMPSSEYYEGRFNQTIVVSLSMLIIFGILLLMINRMVDSKIVQGINRISDSMSKIAAGNFEITVNEQGNPEFTMLSNNINKMVEGICQNIKENEQLIEKQNQDMEQNQRLIQNTLLLAQNAAEQAKVSSQKEADMVIKHANDSAKKILDKAHTDVVSITQEYDRLKQEFVKFRAKFRNFITVQMDTFEDLEKDFIKNYNLNNVRDKANSEDDGIAFKDKEIEQDNTEIISNENDVTVQTNLDDNSFEHENVSSRLKTSQDVDSDLENIKKFFISES